MRRNINGRAIMLVFVCLGLFAAMAATAESRDPVTRVTIHNKSAHEASVALAWFGNSEGGGSKGWFNVEAGERKTIIYPDYVIAGTLGYYAQSQGRVLAGSGEDDGYSSAWIHPEKAFESIEDSPVPGGVKVTFRIVDFTLDRKTGDMRASITLTGR